ncbi:MAG: STAS domain-containing protein [bacterium]
MNSFELKTHKLSRNKTIAVICVGGCIDVFTSHTLEDELVSALENKCYNIIVDLSDVDYISSMGWSIMLNHLSKVRHFNGDLKLANMNKDVYEVYKVLEFHWFLKSYKTLDAAISDFYESAYAVA